MRLTNVAQMTLPPGRVRSFATRVVGEPGRDLPISFDQRRHVAAGERPGSWMAVAFRIPETDPELLATAWLSVIARHGSLRSVFGTDAAGGLALREVELAGTAWVEHPAPEGTDPRVVLREVLDRSCTPFSAPSHLLCTVTPDAGAADPRTVVVIASDHSHVDMWSLLVLVRDLGAAVAALRAHDEPPRTPHAPFAEHTAILASQPPAPETVTARWHEIMADGDMPVFPMPLGDISEPRAEVVEVRDVLDAAESAAFEAYAASLGVRPTAVALAAIAEVTRRLSGQPLRAVFPVHSRNEPRWHDSCGWFITNAVIECEDATPAGCAAAVKEALVLGSYPLAPILAPFGGMPNTPGMFAISWLDTRRLPAVDADLDIQYVSAVIRTDGVMIWFIVNETGLHLRCRTPDTPEARANVGRWLDAVVARMREATVTSTPAAAVTPGA